MIHGVGINDAGYPVRAEVNGELCKYYRTWAEMLRRCYSKSFHRLNSTYIDCYVCDEWLTFSKFRSWMVLQDWKGRHLDKDLLFADNKCYCPTACIFVTQQINNLLMNRESARGKYPRGVTRDKKKFNAGFKRYGKYINLGNFETPEEAFKAYKLAKTRHVVDVAKEQKDLRLKAGLLARAADLYYSIEDCHAIG